MLRTKVLVVGAGPAGSTAARFLSKNGTDTILIEKNLSFIKPCGGGVPSTIFDELGIPKKAIIREIRKVRFVSPRENSIEIEVKGGSLAIVHRGEFDSILREEAKKSGAVLLEADFKQLEKPERQLVARVVIDGKEELIKTDYLIAADGVNSRVRLAVGLKLPSSLYTISEKIKNVDTDQCEFWFGSSHAPKSYSWVFPAAEGISVGTGSVKPEALKDLLKKFQKRRGLDEQNATRIYKIPLWDGELYNKNNIFFAGDSAGHVMPLIYEGIYHAMKAGEFAAMAIISGKPSDYKKMWKRRFYSRFLIMKNLCDYFLKDDNSTEKMVSLFRRKEIQEVCMRLWLEKTSSKGPLISFMKFFKRFLN